MQVDAEKSESLLPPYQRMRYFTVSVVLYLIGVADFLQYRDLHHDVASCASFHASQYGLVFVSGVGFGIAAGPSVAFGLRTLIRNMHSTSAVDVESTLRKLAWGTIFVGMIPSLLWVVSSLNVFIDTHHGLVVEADIIVVLMGLLTGVSWFVLLRSRPWIGVIISTIMVLMVLSTVLTRHGWC